MRTHVLHQLQPEAPAAYVANGVIGLRVGQLPLPRGTALANGYYATDATEQVEAMAPAPYPLGADLKLGQAWLSARPDLVKFQRQSYDFSTGELTSVFSFSADGITAQVTVLTFASRSMPTLALQEVTVTVDKPCDLTVRGMIDPAGIPGRCLHRDAMAITWRVADGCLHWQGEGGIGSVGAAYATAFSDDGKDVAARRNSWGTANAMSSDYSVAAAPSRTYRMQQFGALVADSFHPEPGRQAIRMVGTGQLHGFDELRAANRAAWKDLWLGRVKVEGASERAQDVLDACFFYLHSSCHRSSLFSVPAWGLAETSYRGHVFWDCESFTFPPALLTAPGAARTMLDYRSKRIEAARANAAMNGYDGLQFPWESARTGAESVPSWARAIFTEQHVSMDIAFAFAQYVHATGDRAFEREQAWPVLEGVARFVASRVTATARGFEILHATGIDEEHDNVSNNAEVNLVATVALKEAIAMGARLGIPTPPVWKDIAEKMFVPLYPGTKAIAKHEGHVYKGGICQTEPLAAIFPFGHRASPEVEAATVRHYLGFTDTYLHYPMLGPLLGVYPTLIDDRDTAAELFRQIQTIFPVGPYLAMVEIAEPKGSERQRGPQNAPYVANFAGHLMSVMYGLTGIQLGPEDPSAWGRRPICLPTGWTAITIDRIWARGKAARLEARHGDARATITMGA